MPTYKTGTRQWAEARMRELLQVEVQNGDHAEALSREYEEVSELLESNLPDDPNPVYTKEELEAMGQGGLF